MTLAFAGLFAVVLSIVAGWLGASNLAAAQRLRAQVAADAAALAAAAEAGPYGRGAPMREARRYARANGATLLDCWCEDGAGTVEVRVAVGDAVAEARAEFDATMLSQRPDAGTGGLHPQLARAVRILVAASGGRVSVVSAYRSTARQAALWTHAVRRYGSAEAADDWVARPGFSMHERGLAVDLGGDLALAADLVERMKLPLVRPLAHEPWHFELAAARAM